MNDRMEIAAEIFGRHSGNSGQFIQCNSLPVITIYVFQHRFELHHLSGRFCIISLILIKPFLVDNPKNFK